MLTDINHIVSKLETIKVLPKTIAKQLSLVKLYISLYKFNEKALPELQEHYRKLWEVLYREFKSYPFYSDTPLQKLLREFFDPAYVEPWGYEATYGI